MGGVTGGKLIGFLILLLPLVAGASISMVAAPEGTCFEMYPGDVTVKLLVVTVDSDGWYSLRINTTGILVYPSEKDVYLKEDEPWYEVVRIRAPANYQEGYYLLDVSLWDANNNVVAEEQYCVHVVLEKPVDVKKIDYSLVLNQYEVNGNYFLVPLTVKNTGDVDLEVTLDADYKYVYFSENPVSVEAGKEKEVYAKIPISEDLPEKITFYAFAGGVRKEARLRIDLYKDVDLDVPETITVKGAITRVPVVVENTGTLPVTVSIDGEDLPLGISLSSDTVEIPPASEKTIDAIFVAQGSVNFGDYVVRICAKEGEETLECKYTVLSIPAPEEEVNVSAMGAEKVVNITVENGPVPLEDVEVHVSAPEGWVVRTEPAVLDLAPYERATVSVHLVPTKGAKPGTATVYLRSGSRIVAQEEIQLEGSRVTGFATAGEAPAWVIVIVIIAAVIFALFAHKQQQEEKLKKELKKKKP